MCKQIPRTKPYTTITGLVSVLFGVVAALGAALCWAIAPSLYALGMKDTTPLLAHAVRTSAGGLFSLTVAILWEDFLGQLPFDLFQVGVLIFLGCVGIGFGDWLFLRCLKMTDVSFIVGIVYIYPLFVALCGILFATEKLTLLTFLASLAIVSGVILISTTNRTRTAQLESPRPPTSEVAVKQHLKATMLAILAAFTWGTTIFGLGFSLQYFPPFSANAIRLSSVGGLLFLIFPLSSLKHKVRRPSKSSLAIIGGAGILAIGIGSWLMLVAIGLFGTTKSSALFSVSPFFTALIAILVLREKPTPTRFGGILLVCLGILLISVG